MLSAENHHMRLCLFFAALFCSLLTVAGLVEVAFAVQSSPSGQVQVKDDEGNWEDFDGSYSEFVNKSQFGTGANDDEPPLEWFTWTVIGPPLKIYRIIKDECPGTGPPHVGIREEMEKADAKDRTVVIDVSDGKVTEFSTF